MIRYRDEDFIVFDSERGIDQLHLIGLGFKANRYAITRSPKYKKEFIETCESGFGIIPAVVLIHLINYNEDAILYYAVDGETRIGAAIMAKDEDRDYYLKAYIVDKTYDWDNKADRKFISKHFRNFNKGKKVTTLDRTASAARTEEHPIQKEALDIFEEQKATGDKNDKTILHLKTSSGAGFMWRAFRTILGMSQNDKAAAEKPMREVVERVDVLSEERGVPCEAVAGEIRNKLEDFIEEALTCFPKYDAYGAEQRNERFYEGLLKGTYHLTTCGAPPININTVYAHPWLNHCTKHLFKGSARWMSTKQPDYITIVMELIYNENKHESNKIRVFTKEGHDHPEYYFLQG
jgi:hypothetical protein